MITFALKRLSRLIDKKQEVAGVLFVALIALNVLVWGGIVMGAATGELQIYFLDVGQGDAALAVLPSGARVLIDGGVRNNLVLYELAKILPPADRYIDLTVMSHSHFDHFGGLVDVLENYKVGAFVSAGHESDVPAFAELREVVGERGVREIILHAGDAIRQGENYFLILSPTPKMVELWDEDNSSLVAELNSLNSKVLFTGDIGFLAEEALVSWYDGEVDILKVAHHGSRFSSSEKFMETVKPYVAVVSVGKNSYGHPTSEALRRIMTAGGKVYRTDLHGTVKAVVDGEKIKVYPAK